MICGHENYMTGQAAGGLQPSDYLIYHIPLALSQLKKIKESFLSRGRLLAGTQINNNILCSQTSKTLGKRNQSKNKQMGPS